MPSTRAAGEAQGAPTVPISMLAQEALPPGDSTPISPDTVDSTVTEDLEIAPTTLLTLGEMLARQPEQDVLFHPCEQCGMPIRGEASHCDECAAVEEAEALSRDEKARHERHMSLVRKGVVVTMLVTIFGTYFWFNDPSKLLDGLLPGIFGPTQEVGASKVAHAEVLPSPFVVATLSPLPSGTTGPTATPGSQVVGALNTPGTATLATPVARQNGPALPTVTGVPTPSVVVEDAFTAPTVRPEADEAVASPTASASSLASAPASATSTTTRPQPTQTRAERVASTPTPTRLPPTAVPRLSATSTRTRTPLPAPTGTPTPLQPTVVPTQGTGAVPSLTPTTLPVLPTLTPAVPTVTVALPTVTVPLPTLPVVPTEVRVPEPTVPVVPTVDVPTVDVPSVPTVPVPTDVVPTVPPPTVPAAPEPPTIVPTVTVVPPTVPVPTAQLPPVAASAVPTDLPVVATPTVLGGQQQVVPTVTVPVALP
ncbi:MAG: hypothetical protein M3441_06720 [Chloroflexota bacterium]|nr:hypothetical protein [Chloroflexota bacterium]